MRSLFPALFCSAAFAFLLADLPASAQPANDDFANRILIKKDHQTISGTLSNATSEANEPLLDGISSGQTAWWTWTAPSNGTLSITGSADGFDPLITLFTGDQLANLSLVASNNYQICYSDGVCGCHWRMRDGVAFPVVQGQSYQISMDSPIYTDASIGLIFLPLPPPHLPIPTNEVIFSTNIAPGSGVQLTLDFTPVPRNDDFARATVIRGSRLKVAVNNTAATKEPGEPDHAGNSGGSSVWFSWTAPASGRVTLSTNEISLYVFPPFPSPPNGIPSPPIQFPGVPLPPPILPIPIPIGPIFPVFGCGVAADETPMPIFHPLLAAYTGTEVNALTPAPNSQPVGLDAYPYAIEFDAVKGHVYHFACDGYMGTTGAFNLYLALTQPAANDTFAHRIPLAGAYPVALGYNASAVKQPGAPDIGNGSTGKLVWWSWTSPISGLVTNNLSNSDYSFPAAVFTGSKLSSLQMIASGAGQFTFATTVGQTYQIAVGDLNGQTGEIRMQILGPLVALPLVKAISGWPDELMLTYQASPGQVILLQHYAGPGFLNQPMWNPVQIATAHGHEVNFFLKSAPRPSAPSDFRAIVVNYISY